MQWVEYLEGKNWKSKGNGRDSYTITLKNGEYRISRFMYRLGDNIEKIRDIKIQNILDNTNISVSPRYSNLEGFFIGVDQWKFTSLKLAKNQAECDYNSYPDITLNPLSKKISSPDGGYLWE